MAYESILVDKKDGVGVITLNRPEALNALNRQLMTEVTQALADFDADDAVGCIVLTGSQKAFAAGADIKEMSDRSFLDMYLNDVFEEVYCSVARCRKPIVAAVAGYALGGGCEIAMMCDIILAADNAKFGQPEITIGVMPGIGGTQRLPRAIGKSKAMEMCLTGRMMSADEAERAGLVSRVIPLDELMDETLATARKIAEMSTPIAIMTKEAVNRAYEGGLGEGVRFERRLFNAMFATEDQKEGMGAFVEKRAAQFKNR